MEMRWSSLSSYDFVKECGIEFTIVDILHSNFGDQGLDSGEKGMLSSFRSL